MCDQVFPVDEISKLGGNNLNKEANHNFNGERNRNCITSLIHSVIYRSCYIESVSKDDTRAIRVNYYLVFLFSPFFMLSLEMVTPVKYSSLRIRTSPKAVAGVRTPPPPALGYGSSSKFNKIARAASLIIPGAKLKLDNAIVEGRNM